MAKHRYVMVACVAVMASGCSGEVSGAKTAPVSLAQFPGCMSPVAYLRQRKVSP